VWFSYLNEQQLFHVRFSSPECWYVLYFTLVRSKLEYASVVWNSITSTDANKLEHIQQKCASVCFYRFFLYVLYTYTDALEKLILQSLHRRDTMLMHFFLLRSIMALNTGLPFWKILAFVFLPAILGTSNCLVFVYLINTVLLLSAPVLPTWWVKISTYLRSETFLSITFILIYLKLLIMFVHTPYVLCYIVLRYHVLVTTLVWVFAYFSVLICYFIQCL
jgi:hypothetical protein